MGVLRDAAVELQGLLDDRTRRVLAFRYGLETGKEKTLQAIGDAEHITRERVRQIERAGLQTLRPGGAVIPERALLVQKNLLQLLEGFGGAALEETLLAAVGGEYHRDRAALRFLLSTLQGVTEARETQRTYAHWKIAEASAPTSTGPEPLVLEAVLEAAEQVLRRSREVLSEHRLLAGTREQLQLAVSDAVLHSLLSIGKRIVRTPFGDFGIRGWPEATPRGVGDKAYIVLKREGKPLHFTAITEQINTIGFDAKRAHAQTVHNELIRNHRFVLVGRGLYGLTEWGLEPGTVADVLAKALERAGRPLPRNELVAAVLEKRLVKRNTVLLALHNSSRFQALPDGTYTVATPAPAERGAAATDTEHRGDEVSPPTSISRPSR